jgi:phenylacetate-CoA ligase
MRPSPASRLLTVYHRLPSPARSVAASARGYYLRWLRYDDETDRRVEEAREREYWPPERWPEYQDEAVARLLHRAATEVPYYRNQWSRRRSRGDRSSWEVLSNWPILEKESLRANARSFLADDCNPRRMVLEHTSGTTGTPLHLWSSRETQRVWYALFEARWRGWEGVSRRDRWVMLGGQLVTPVGRRKPPFWVWNAAFRQLYLSVYHLAPDLVGHYLEAIRRFRPRYILGYTSALHLIALEAKRRTWRPPENLVAVLTNAEPLLSHQREAITAAFGCPVRETYGMSEMVAAAGECAAGSLHLWPEVGRVEIVDGDRPIPVGETGELVATGLLNRDMPLIRYRIGDRGALDPVGTSCECGRSLPRLRSLEGRSDDLLFTRDGRVVGRLDPVFKGDLPIREAQIIQESLDCVRVLYIPASDDEPDLSTLVSGLRARLGDVRVDLEAVEAIPRGANGKLQGVISKVARPTTENLADDATDQLEFVRVLPDA